jgi:hypothetical protein
MCAGGCQPRLVRCERGQAGQAAAELVAIIPILICALLLVAQLAVAGYALWTAGGAARAGARALHVGGDPEAAAMSALPLWLEHDAEVDPDGPVEVRLRAPALLPGVPDIPVEAGAALGPGEGDDG